MLITRVRAKNWRNFPEVDISLKEFTYFVGANGAGKSNLLDIFCFLGDICREGIGGLQFALMRRGGLAFIRSLFNVSGASKKNTTTSLDIEISGKKEKAVIWRYKLILKMEGQGRHRDLVAKEQIWKNGRLVLNRPSSADNKDPQRLTQTYLEQSSTNTNFRELVTFFASNCCLSPFPPLFRPDKKIQLHQNGVRILGTDLMERIEQVQESARNFRMNTIGRMMQLVIPEFSEILFKIHKETGKSYLEARYTTYRQRNLQTGEWFTDDMLRIIDFFWSLLDDLPFLMITELEKFLPDNLLHCFSSFLIELRRLKKDKTYRLMPQIVVATNSELLLGGLRADNESVIVLETGKTGSLARELKTEEIEQIRLGKNLADILKPFIQVTLPSKIRFYK